MKRLTKTQQYAILYMLSQDKDKTEIIKTLKISEESLSRFIEKNTTQTQTNKIKTKSNTTRAKDLMINKTSAKNTSGVSIMTKEASGVADDYRKNLNSNNIKKTDSAIYRPNG